MGTITFRQCQSFWFRGVVVPLVLCCSMLVGCPSYRTDPLSMLPLDPQLWMEMAPPASQSMGSFLSRLVDGRGVSHLLFSLTGINLLEPARCKESGIDPDRSVVVAASAGHWVLILPVTKRSLAERRVALRAARFGFQETQASQKNIRHFMNHESWHLSLRIMSDLLLIAVGPTDPSAWVAALQKRPKGYESLRNTRALAGQKRPDMTGVIHNNILVEFVLGKLLPAASPLQTSALRAWMSVLGDLHFSLQTEYGLQGRLILGTSEKPPPLFPKPATLPKNAALLAQLNIPPVLLTLLKNQFKNRPDLHSIIDTLEGHFTLTMPSDSQLPPKPLLSQGFWRNHLRLVVSARLRPRISKDMLMTSLSVAAVRGQIQTYTTLADKHESKARTFLFPGGPEVSLDIIDNNLLAVLGNKSQAYKEQFIQSHPTFFSDWMASTKTHLLHLSISPGLMLMAINIAEIAFLELLLGSIQTVDLQVAWTQGQIVADLHMVIP